MNSYELMELVNEYQVRQRDQRLAAFKMDEANVALTKARRELINALMEDASNIVAPGLDDGQMMFYEVDIDDGGLIERSVQKVLR